MNRIIAKLKGTDAYLRDGHGHIISFTSEAEFKFLTTHAHLYDIEVTATPSPQERRRFLDAERKAREARSETIR